MIYHHLVSSLDNSIFFLLYDELVDLGLRDLWISDEKWYTKCTHYAKTHTMWIGCYRYSFQNMMVLYVGSI
jgi:hypothetical protein